MGRDTTGREMNSTQSGIQAYELEIILGHDHETALRAALEASIHVARREFTRGTRADILEKAEDLDATENPGDDSIVFDGAAALIWYAELLDETLPPEQRLGGV